jgi:hypothetical protein
VVEKVEVVQASEVPATVDLQSQPAALAGT